MPSQNVVTPSDRRHPRQQVLDTADAIAPTFDAVTSGFELVDSSILFSDGDAVSEGDALARLLLVVDGR